MKKTILYIVLAALCLNFRAKAQAVTKLTGRVIDSAQNTPLHGATIKIKSTGTTTSTNEKGDFTLYTKESSGKLTISYLGYKTTEISFNPTDKDPFAIRLAEDKNLLKEVSVVSTGYQNIPKERATGSFVLADSALLNRSVSTNILDRLNSVTSGVLFNNSSNLQFGQSAIEIRGRATLFSNPSPLIIIDNFPYDGDPGNINPNDIESITILKDAAAASAWGSRSGNGVIVITTKKGHLNSAPQVSFNANTTVGARPDLYYLPQLTSAQYIGVEQYLFNQGAYDNAISTGYQALSPAVEIFSAARNGTISKSDSLSEINTLKSYDSRAQLLKYFYRPSVNQQYQASVSGGSATQKYFFSAGYDKNLNNTVNSSYDRITLNAANTWYFLKNKLELFTNIVYTGSTTKSGPALASTDYPYDQIADANGNPLAIANTLSIPYGSTAGNGALLNWLYKPLQELENGYSGTTSSLTDYRINVSLSYQIIKGLKASGLYNYEKGINDVNNLNELQSYYTRNLINTFTNIDPVSGAVTYPVPMGAILNTSLTNISSNNGRFQLNYDHHWGKNAVSAIAGTEVKDYTTFNNAYTLYGYNPETATDQNQAVDFTAYNPYFYGYNTAQIPANTSETGTTNRFFSVYFNGSYTYDDKYILSLSARKDESNLFGVSANQKGVPLGSAGLAWIIDKESFYAIDWLPQLKLRATYGYTGNVNTSISAYLAAVGGNIAQTYNAYASTIVNPPNPSLRWEVDRNTDLGMDFGTKDNRISGSIDYWLKAGLDLIGSSPIAPQTGISLYTGNSANTITKGIDLQINSINLKGKFKWTTTFLYNYCQNKVTQYKVSNGTNLNVVSANYNNPLQGYPYYAIFSFKYAGLNKSGDPQGYLNGKISTDYTSIMNATNRTELVYNGSATPTSFGSLRNTFNYKTFDLSFNITYKLGYYFRRASLNNGTLYSAGPNSYQMADFDSRWQKPGDELHTNVPALVYPDNIYRDDLYTYSNILVVNAAHIRLQDLRLGYTIPKRPICHSET
ncbi:TonB-dependent Receptor Plug Domain protein [Mucilaginibacter gotjawali]|uniref:TonB-dependent Receptor Plug Domain protein n=1 Tax=Mucilaginibacter gotjawali TaxID=1550579 RepID=A0A0X8X4L4_9SPHI|nr:SusC/RagA family TonB-linked outer membrane protein [Mucilaginibacter gotjawali]BAU55605.1 TonB-dependent Receptor Plug Domain protein [Mucilaginibacter gotjawali]